MPKKRRRAKIPTPAWDRPRGTLARRLMGRGSQFYGAVVVAVLIAIGLGVIGYAFLADELEDWRRPGSTAIQVDDTRFRLDYFAKRMTMYVDQNGGQDVVSASSAMPAVSDLLIQEEIVHRFASDKNVKATDDEIKEEIASRLGITADDESFDVVFQQELTRSGLSEKDYRRMIQAAVLTEKLRKKFLKEVPKSAESVRYRQILVSEQSTAEDIKRQIEAGKDFAKLAAKNSLDTTTKDKGGNVGWVPRGVLEASTEELIFSMKVGEITIIPSSLGSMIVQMLKKDADHPVAKSQKEPLADALLSKWIEKKRQSLSIVNNVNLRGDYDFDKVKWVVDHVYSS